MLICNNVVDITRITADISGMPRNKQAATKSIATAIPATAGHSKETIMGTMPVSVHTLHLDGSATVATMTVDDAAAYVARWATEVRAITVYR